VSVPRLRFPGFVGEWHSDKLTQKVTKVGSGVTPKGGAEVYQSQGVPLIRSQNVRGDALDLSDVAYISDEINGSMSGSAVQPNDVLLNITGASIGRSCVVPSDFAIGNVNQHVCIIRMVPDADPNFLQTFLASHRGQKLIFQSQSGSGREGLNFENIRAFKVAFPTLPEQKKIAAFLGVVDAKIAALRARVLGLETYKRGLMQALFSQRLRFTKPDGTAFPDWEEKRLGEVFDWVKTNSLSREFLNYEGGEVQNIHYGDIHTKFKPTFAQDAENVPFVNEGAMPKGFTDEEYCRLGDVVIADASEDYADIGKAIEIVQVRQRSLVAGLHSYIARPKPITVVLGFSGYLFRTPKMRRQMMRIAQGISVLGISKPNLSKLELQLPHPDEQAKIAGALSAMDAKIAAVQAQVHHMQAFKKGLLQQMFV
jgi:type I restriction enzyme, S subunit